MIGLILNPRSGYVAAHGLPYVRAQITAVLPEVRIHVLQPGDDLAACCRALIADGATCIAVAGGDGSVSAVATHLVGTDIPLGVIPAGTLNHFARDVGVGRDVVRALHVLAGGYTLPVDVARVNERIFLNNSSIGLYARMVEIRRRYETRLGKWRALVHAARLVAWHARATEVQFGGETLQSVRTYLLFVGNNQYELDLLHLGRRSCLDAGALCCVILEAPGRLALLPHVFHHLRGHRPYHHVLRSLGTHELTVIPGRARRVEVACDGEVFTLTAPLVYRILPRALKVVVPKPPPPESREMRAVPDVCAPAGQI
jgi:diacylglycerol kinase family enzyme